MKVALGNLKPGQWRNLTVTELAEINQAVSYSSKTAIDTEQAKPERKPRQSEIRKKLTGENNSHQPAKKMFVNKNSKNTTTQTANVKATLKLKRK